MARRFLFVALLAALALATAAAAREVRIGYGAAVTSADPHFHALTSNVAVHQHIYEALVGQDERLGLRPELANGWRAVDATTWEFALRPTARWHDGTPFTAEDVAFSAGRAATVPNSPGRFTISLLPVLGLDVVGPHTLRVRTDGPDPLLPNRMAGLLLVRRATGDASTADFNAGRAAVGTGPYRFRAWRPGSRFELERNDAYDGPAEPWRRMTFLLISGAAARLAALRAGDADLVDQVPTDEVAALSRDPDLAVFAAPGLRNMYLFLDQARERTPGVADAAGNPIPNPLRDPRVRRALSLAINRDGIVRSLMGGQAAPSGQLLPPGVPGHEPDLRPDPYDPDRARALLEEAGLTGGFTVVLAGPNDRYVNDDQVLQSIAQGWTRAGLKVRVEALPSAAYFPQVARGGVSVGLLGWGTATGEADSPLVSLLATEHARRGWGAGNRSGYSNPALDALVAEAVRTAEPARRDLLYRRATRIAMEDVAIIPLHQAANIWAARRGLTYNARNDERTMATELRPAAARP
jgi:peptide/nickel transport system substrate-binding protein